MHDAADDQLSRDRAAFVRSFLIVHGIDSSRLEAVGVPRPPKMPPYSSTVTEIIVSAGAPPER